MDPDFALNLAAFFVVFIVIAVVLRFLAPIVLKHFKGSAGGWSRLVAVYATTRPLPAQARSRQSIVVGQVLYRNCMTVGFDDSGLYLEIGFPLSVFGRRALFIPWREFKHIDEGRLFWRKATLMSLGDPPVGTITLPMSLFEAIRPALPLTVRNTLQGAIA